MAGPNSTRSFLMLSAIGFALLWPMMVYNGTLGSLLQAGWLGVFADGRPFRTVYTGVFVIDFATSILVAFFEDQINGLDEGAWLLMLDLVMSLQAATIWALVEAYRQNLSKKMSRLYLLLPFLWNVFGAAIFLPLFFLLQMRCTQHTTVRPPVPETIGRTLIPATILMAFAPALGMLYAYLHLNEPARQAVTAFYQFAPLMLPVTVTFLSIWAGNGSQSIQSYRSRRLVKNAYLLAASSSMIAHINTLSTLLLYCQDTTAFTKVFVPSVRSVVPGSITNIHDGASLFLQYDWIVINLACALWMYYSTAKGCFGLPVLGSLKRISFILLLCFFVGPGGVVSMVLWVREEDQGAKKTKF